jgi:DNA-binding NarL/FixJ family response regulator
VDGLEATRLITAHPALAQVRVLLLAEEAQGEQLFAALRAGASGFLTMDSEPGEVVGAVRVLAGGGGQLSPQDTRRLIDQVACQPPLPTPRRFDELSARERQVVSLVALGLSNPEIAERLVVSPATAKTHVTRSMLKLQVHDRARLVALAYQTGFARPGDTIASGTGGQSAAPSGPDTAPGGAGGHQAEPPLTHSSVPGRRPGHAGMGARAQACGAIRGIARSADTPDSAQ